jgi:superfamily II DNA or RNA helicase
LKLINISVSNDIRAEGLTKELSTLAIKENTAANPEYVTRQRLGKWTGGVEPEICLARFDAGALVLPRGYFGRLVANIEAAGLGYEIADRRLRLPKIEMSFRGELRTQQAAALEAMTKYGSGVLVAPCGSGKTAVGMALISFWRQPSLILVHTKTLAEQTREAATRWLGITPGLIGDGVFDVRPVTVGIIQSLAGNRERIDAIKGRFGLVMLDEAHHCPASTFTDLLQRFPGSFRYGLTATPERRDGLSSFMTAVIGPVRYEITHEDLRNAGLLVVPRIVYERTDFFYPFGDDWVRLMDELTKNGERNEIILSILDRLIEGGYQVIALSERVKHVEYLAERINAQRPGAAEVITGKIGAKKRNAALERVRSGEARVMLSTKLADEGLDIPKLDALVLLTPSRDKGRTTQRAGRVLRTADGKRQPVIVDVADPLTPVLFNQARTRFFEAYRRIAPGVRLPHWLEKQRARAA